MEADSSLADPVPEGVPVKRKKRTGEQKMSKKQKKAKPLKEELSKAERYQRNKSRAAVQAPHSGEEETKKTEVT